MPADRATHDLLGLDAWEGPIFGEPGVLASDGDRLECHACGRWFRFLGAHVWQAHRLSAEEYKALFGLNATTGLVVPALKARFAAHAREVFAGHTEGQERVRALTPAERSALNRGRQWRLEARQNPRNQQLRAVALQRALEQTRTLVAAGAWPTRPFPDPRAASQLGNARRSALLREDPAYRARFSQRLSEAHGGRTARTCIVCGGTFLPPPYKKTCSRACDRTRRQAASRAQPRDRARTQAAARRAGGRAAVYEATLARLQALPPAAFAVLAPRVQELVALYYGLADGRPRTQRELSVAFGLDGRKVWRAVREGVAQLLAEPTPG